MGNYAMAKIIVDMVWWMLYIWVWPTWEMTMAYQFPSWLGWQDYRAGLGFRAEYDSWSRREQNIYENGRQRAANYKLAFGHLPPKQVKPQTYQKAANLVGPAFAGRSEQRLKKANLLTSMCIVNDHAKC
jgi:hypothetical protein